jgi:hypothetical protein
MADQPLPMGTRIVIRGTMLAKPQRATIVQTAFRSMPWGWYVVETDSGDRQLIHRDRFTVVDEGATMRMMLLHYSPQCCCTAEAPAALPITKRVVDGLKATGGEYFIWDDKLVGFGVRVQPSGAKSFDCFARECTTASNKSAGTLVGAPADRV